jgi:hypothetical protein
MEYPRRRGLCYDPIEDTEEFKKVLQEIQKQLDEYMEDMPSGMGSCHAFWQFKKKLLSLRGIEWKSPKECNPHVMFD